ncbi:hypothetical protein BN1708_002486 [Verticillium longisporum]|nr:hypothetical protein BN1708_002486 [Verticillium longisporum]
MVDIVRPVAASPPSSLTFAPTEPFGTTSKSNSKATSIETRRSNAAYMGANLDANGAVDKQTSSRSFFSRFSLPIRTRTRHVADFHVRPNEPHRQYNAGDNVRGSVVLTIVKPVRITHLTVALHGYVRVFKGPAIAERELASPILTSGRSSAQYHGNGYASLFQDEQVLAGEGRLEAAKYEFQFDLQFPEKGLPSSIDFERGTISYMITATLTRPTTIAPTTTCDRKISLVEKIDIGLLPRPRPRTIYLEPISKKSRRRKQQQTIVAPANTNANGPAAPLERPPPTNEATEHASDHESHVERCTISEDTQQDAHDNPRSPLHQQQDGRSEMSGDSGLTSTSGMSDRGTEHQTASSLAANAKLQAVDEKTITATVELLRGGAVAGDTATVKVSVQHIKRLKSMHGVIVTMYRQGRIDTAPPASLFADMVSKDDARKLQKEEYYPRSRTGLGGLSLSSTTSQSVFRKDLSQAVAPLIIDPATMETTVMASLKVPEDAFPTIKGVPGEMISFKYHIEVLVDLGGRLANQLQSGGQSRAVGFSSSQPTEGYTARSGNVIDTDRLRREKGVISVVFELVMGTADSSKERGRSNTLRTYHVQEDAVSQDEIISPWSEEHAEGDDGSSYWQRPTPTRSTRPPGPLSRQHTADTAHMASPLDRGEAPAYVPAPQIEDESVLTEKERVRRQEQRLLPSQPSAADAGPSGASVPEANIYDADDGPPSAPPLHEPSRTEANSEHDAPSAPTLEDIAGPASHPTEDKLEVERQRLMNEASAPPEFPEDYEAGPSHRPSAPPADAADALPSAPVLTDEDEYGGQYSYPAGPSSPRDMRSGSEQLPRYER